MGVSHKAVLCLGEKQRTCLSVHKSLGDYCARKKGGGRKECKRDKGQPQLVSKTRRHCHTRSCYRLWSTRRHTLEINELCFAGDADSVRVLRAYVCLCGPIPAQTPTLYTTTVRAYITFEANTEQYPCKCLLLLYDKKHTARHMR